jgi:hypothetical protein
MEDIGKSKKKASRIRVGTAPSTALLLRHAMSCQSERVGGDLRQFPLIRTYEPSRALRST